MGDDKTFQGGYDNYVRSTRWVPVYNASRFWVPAFGCLYIPERDPTDTDYANFVGSRILNNQEVFVCYRPDGYAAAHQNPGQHLFNGPVPIPPRDFGSATMDYPCRGMHFRMPPAANGTTVGPVKDAFYLGREGDAFNVMGHPQMNAAPGTAGYHQLWIAPARKQENSAAWLTWNGTVANNKPWQLTGVSMINVTDNGPIGLWNGAFYGLTTGTTLGLPATWPGGAALSIGLRPGVYHIDCYATLSGSTDLSVIGFVCQLNGTATVLQGWRTYTVDDDSYASKTEATAENVCASGPLVVTEDSFFQIRNISGENVTSLYAFLNIRKVAAYVDPGTYRVRPGTPDVATNASGGGSYGGGAGDAGSGGGAGGGAGDADVSDEDTGDDDSLDLDEDPGA